VGELAGRMLRAQVLRLRLPRWQTERIQQIVSAQKRLVGLRPREPLPRALLRRAYLEEAVDLLELGYLATGAGREALSRLRKGALPAVLEAERRTAAPEPEPEPGRRRRRRSRHRRRGVVAGT
jgi:hypothetical protein